MASDDESARVRGLSGFKRAAAAADDDEPAAAPRAEEDEIERAEEKEPEPYRGRAEIVSSD